VVHGLNGVGQNLHDHLTTVLIYRTPRQDATFGLSVAGFGAIVRTIFEWRRQRSGPITSNVAETQGFLQTDPTAPAPDIQLALCTGIVDDHTRKNHLGHGYTLHVTLMRPKSRGQVWQIRRMSPPWRKVPAWAMTSCKARRWRPTGAPCFTRLYATIPRP
jgi:choline dehydrogenase